MKIASLMRSYCLEVDRRENVWILTIECVRERDLRLLLCFSCVQGQLGWHLQFKLPEEALSVWTSFALF